LVVAGMADAIHGDIVNVSTSWLLTSSQQTKQWNMGLEAQRFLHMAERMHSVSWKSDGEGRMTYPKMVIRSAIDR
jgi:hypothetical protein